MLISIYCQYGGYIQSIVNAMEHASSQHSSLTVSPMYSRGFLSVPTSRWSYKLTEVLMLPKTLQSCLVTSPQHLDTNKPSCHRLTDRGTASNKPQVPLIFLVSKLFLIHQAVADFCLWKCMLLSTTQLLRTAALK